MKETKAGLALWLVGCLLVLSNSVFAHHSESMLDKDRLVTVKGTITEHVFVNPHQIIKMKVTNANGKVTLWTIQGTSIPQMRDIGWTKDYLKPGDEATIALYGCKDGSPCGSWMRIVKADGTELPMPPFKKRMLGEFLQLHGNELPGEEYEIYKKSVTTGIGALPDPKKAPAAQSRSQGY